MIAVTDPAKQTWLLDVAGGDHRLASWLDPSGEPPMWQRVAP
jgi:hypothetical protein